MVWAGFCSSGKLNLAFTSSRMNSKDYIQVLNSCLVPFIHKYPRKKFIFQQDNAAIHTSTETKKWLESQNINLLNWPARSPDYNPVENLWGIIVRQNANNKQYSTVNELKIAISEAWENISATTLKNLVNSMKNRIFQMINKNGAVTDY